MHHVDDIFFQLQHGCTFLQDFGWNYLYQKTWYKLFFGLFDGHGLICCNTPCFSWKTSTWSKGNKDGNSFPHNCCLIIVLQCLGRKFLKSDGARKKVALNMTGPQTIIPTLMPKTNFVSNISFLKYCKDIMKNCYFVILSNSSMACHTHLKW